MNLMTRKKSSFSKMCQLDRSANLIDQADGHKDEFGQVGEACLS